MGSDRPVAPYPGESIGSNCIRLNGLRLYRSVGQIVLYKPDKLSNTLPIHRQPVASAPGEREMEMARDDFRKELRSLLDHYVFTSRSDAIRLELCGAIEDGYVAGHLSRDEFHAAMAEL